MFRHIWHLSHVKHSWHEEISVFLKMVLWKNRIANADVTIHYCAVLWQSAGLIHSLLHWRYSIIKVESRALLLEVVFKKTIGLLFIAFVSLVEKCQMRWVKMFLCRRWIQIQSWWNAFGWFHEREDMHANLMYLVCLVFMFYRRLPRTKTFIS